jgi:cytochrome c oxidase subunit III
MTPTNHSSGIRTGLIVFTILAALSAIEFLLAIFFNEWPLIALVALLKAGLVVYYYMHIYRLFEPDESDDHESPAYKLATNRIGLWLFLLSDFFIFGGLLLSRVNLLGLTRPDLKQFLGLAVSVILIFSSVFAYFGETYMQQGNRKRFLICYSVTITLGILFLIGVVGVEWQIAPFGPGDGVAGAIFYVMTGFHAFHVLSGVIFLIIVLRNGLRGLYSPEKHWAVEASAVYWHFVDVVWFFFYPALYLIGTLVQ